MTKKIKIIFFPVDDRSDEDGREQQSGREALKGADGGMTTDGGKNIKRYAFLFFFSKTQGGRFLFT